MQIHERILERKFNQKGKHESTLTSLKLEILRALLFIFKIIYIFLSSSGNCLAICVNHQQIGWTEPSRSNQEQC